MAAFLNNPLGFITVQTLSYVIVLPIQLKVKRMGVLYSAVLCLLCLPLRRVQDDQAHVLQWGLDLE